MEKFALFVQKFRYALLAIILAITVFFGYFLKDLKVDADVLGYLPEDDLAAILFTEIGKKYGGNDMVIIGLEADNVFSAEMLEIVRVMTDSIKSVEGVGYVTSLTNVIDIKSTDFGLEIGRLVDEYEMPQDDSTLTALKEYTLSKEMYKGNLVSADAKATLIIAKILSEDNRNEIVETIRARLNNIPYDGKIYYAGMPVTLAELGGIIMKDILMVTPAAFLLICFILLLGFRNARGVILPMLTVLVAII